jgi:hypothetical protein
MNVQIISAYSQYAMISQEESHDRKYAADRPMIILR